MKIFRVFGVWLPLVSLAVLSPSSAGAEPMTSSLARLIASATSVSCSFDKSDASSSEKGTVYVAQNKMRGEFTVSNPSDGTFQMHMIRDGDWSYTWGGPMGENQGIKMNASGASHHGQRSGPDMDADMSLECQPWPADPGQFTLPTDVQFTELGGGMGGMLDMKQMQCAACDQAPEGSERDQCRQAIGCS